MDEGTSHYVPVGRISGVYGVKGWVRVHSYTSPAENILGYRPWYLRHAETWVRREVAAGRRQGKTVVALLADCTDRDAARAVVGSEVAIRRDQLPPLPPDEYYWSDLIGLRVVTVSGVELGAIDHLIETGANDVLVVHGDRERLIPFLPGDVVQTVDLQERQVRVDWDPEL